MSVTSQMSRRGPLVPTILVIAAQDRTDAEPGWIDGLKRQLGALATALKA